MSNSAAIVTRAFRRLVAIDINEQPSPAEMSHGLDLMGEMVNGWGALGIVTANQSLVADLVSGDDRVRNVTTDTRKLFVGLNVSGTGVPTNATVKEVITDTVFRLSAAATLSAGASALAFAFLPVAAQHEGAMVALLAQRIKGDMGISLPGELAAELRQDAIDGWTALLTSYLPDRKTVFDRALAPPAGSWDINQGWIL